MAHYCFPVVVFHGWGGRASEQVVVYHIQNVVAVNTSRKHGKKEPQSFVHCGSFDHPDMQSLNDYKFFSFLFYDCNLEILGACNTPLVRYFQDLSRGIFKASKLLEL
jgi:hypothetical protein